MIPLVPFLVGLAIGIATAAPVGPVNILAISATLRRGVAAGLSVGLGALAADVVIAAVCALGVSAVIDFVSGHERAIQAVGGLVLVGFGLATTTSHPHLADAPGAGEGGGHGRRLAAAFAMTATNPGALLGMLALFGALRPLTGLEETREPILAAAVVVAGVAAGGLAWWVLLTLAVAAMRRRLDDRWLERLNRIAGALLVAAGLVLALRALLAG